MTCTCSGFAWSGERVLGIRFECQGAQREVLEKAMPQYLHELGIRNEWLHVVSGSHAVTYALKLQVAGEGTLDFYRRPEFALRDTVVSLPAVRSKRLVTRKVSTVSSKEILLALLFPGRVTEFAGEHCSVEALRDHVGIRQNIVAWSENLNWLWPNGGPARWNGAYWRKGTPHSGVLLTQAMNDVFLYQHKYAIGCYTATKLVMVQGVLDYYSRVKKDPVALKRVEEKLWSDGDPLVAIEPRRMWDFEKDFDFSEHSRPGKLLTIQYGVHANHFVPGDWSYFLNTDEVTYEKTGYEGSNAIYLGRDRFDDYYNDHDHSYSYAEKLDEVWQWRNGVFSRSRDAAKIKPLKPGDLKRLGKTPDEGGLVLDLRTTPLLF